MPFGLTNAPSTFQAVMNDVFREYLDDFVMVYIEDILIFSRTAEDNLRHVKLILARLRQHQLFAKRSKCEFNRASLPFLGHVVGQGGMAMQQRKVQVLADWDSFNHSHRSAVLPRSGELLPPLHPGLRPRISSVVRADQEGRPVLMGGRTGEFFSEPQRCSQKCPSVAVGGSFKAVHCNVRRE
jgi:hypothetical protein